MPQRTVACPARPGGSLLAASRTPVSLGGLFEAARASSSWAWFSPLAVCGPPIENSTPDRFVSEMSALFKSASLDKSALTSFAPDKSALRKQALDKSELSSHALANKASSKIAPDKLALWRFAQDSFA